MKEFAYFDNAATTFPKPENVYLFMDKFYRTTGVNVARGQYNLASVAANLRAETRDLILRLFSANGKKVAFTHTATEALNLILKGLAFNSTTTVYVSPFEHNAVMRVLDYLTKNNGIKVKVLPYNKENYSYDLSKIEYEFVLEKPTAVILSHASNAFGLIASIEQIFSIAKKYNSINILDMCQTAGLLNINLSQDLIDFAIFAGHKTLYGPLGISGFIFNDNYILEPLIIGGTGNDSQNFQMPDSTPERYEAGTVNIHAIAGLNAALKWIEATSQVKIYEKEQQNLKQLLELLNKYMNIHVLPTRKQLDRVGIVSCIFDNYSSDSIGNILSQLNVAVRTGLHCAPEAHRFLDTFPAGTVRFSVSYFTNEKDFAILERALEYILLNA